MDIGKDCLSIVVFSDASLNNLQNGSSAKGHVICLYNKQNRMVNMITWCSKKIKRKAYSIFASETLGFQDAMGTGVYIKNILGEILYSDAVSKQS